MPAGPLWVRVPIEYGVYLGMAALIAWIYSSFAGAIFILAWGVAVMFMASSYFVIIAFTRKWPTRGPHLFTATLLILTSLVLLKVIELA